jgi:hypothetical protein
MPEEAKSKIEATRRRWSAFLDRNVKVIRTVDFGLGLACAGIAWTSGGDMYLIVPALIVGFIFAAIGIRSIPDMSKFWKLASTVAVGAIYLGIGCFLHWHFSPVKAASESAAEVQTPAIPVPAKPATQPSQRLLSTAGKMLLSCAVPPGDKKKRAEAKRNFQKISKIYDETFGISLTLSDIEDGYVVEIQPKTQEGRTKMGEVSRVVIREQRVGENIMVSYSWEMPGLLGGVLTAVPIDADADQTKQAVKQVEQLLGPAAQDKCKLL